MLICRRRLRSRLRCGSCLAPPDRPRAAEAEMLRSRRAGRERLPQPTLQRGPGRAPEELLLLADTGHLFLAGENAPEQRDVALAIIMGCCNPVGAFDMLLMATHEAARSCGDTHWTLAP